MNKTATSNGHNDTVVEVEPEKQAESQEKTGNTIVTRSKGNQIANVNDQSELQGQKKALNKSDLASPDKDKNKG